MNYDVIKDVIIFRINILHVYNTMNNADNTDIQSYQGFYLETVDPNRPGFPQKFKIKIP